MIHYEYDSTKEDNRGNSNIENYFNRLAESLKSTGKTITLTGHTDSDGEAAYNMDLGLKRAEEFKTHLIDRGVPNDKIIVASKGESMPIAANDTPEGKRQNRRVEIRINN